MVRTSSTMLALGTHLPDFSLRNVDGCIVAREDFRGAPAVLVIFLCNHCPYVKHIADELARFTAEYLAKGLAVVGINANDPALNPADSPEQMIHEVEMRGYAFPYLFDEDQDVAKRFQAACTPDFFLFDAEQRLIYRGQFDDSRPQSDIPVTGCDLRVAMDAVMAGAPVPEPQKPSLGCNIKWTQGNEPDYFTS